MVNFRFLPPVGGGTHTVNGRLYSAADGVPVDVPMVDSDALIQQQTNAKNYWSQTAPGVPVGPTSARPTAPNLGVGTMYLDTTISPARIIVWNVVKGAWIDPASGAAV